MRRYYIVPPMANDDVSEWGGEKVLTKSPAAESSNEGMISLR